MYPMRHAPFRRLLRVASVTFATALPLSAQAFSDIFVLGDSLSGAGNNPVLPGADPGQVRTDQSYIPTYPYAAGRDSQAEVWTASFAAALALDASAAFTGGTIDAHGGAHMRSPSADGAPSLRLQVRSFLGEQGGVADRDALSVWMFMAGLCGLMLLIHRRS
jgi:phospholipase/lecithinase/hemolysin